MSMETREPQCFDSDSWVDMHGDYLFRCALRYVQDRSLAEELVQETFLAALKSQEEILGEAAQKVWLMGILKHRVFDHCRRVEGPLRQDAIQDDGAGWNPAMGLNVV